MNEFTAIQHVPDDASFLKIFRRPHIGEWASASQLCKEVIWDGLCGRGELHRVGLVLNRLESLTQQGYLESNELKNMRNPSSSWVRLDGQMVNTADPESMAPFMCHPVARGLTMAYRITSSGQNKISNARHIRPIFLSAMLTATTACSTFKSTEAVMPQRRVVEAHRELFQERDQAGKVFWSYCENECPKATPKILASPALQRANPIVHKQIAVQASKVNEESEEVKVSIFFKLNAASIAPEDQSKLSALLAGGYKWKSAVVTGRADPLGASSFNERLSNKRAQQMIALLESAGVPKEMITSDVKVELSKVSAEVMTVGKVPNGIDRQSRRVDIELVRTKKSEKQK